MSTQDQDTDGSCKPGTSTQKDEVQAGTSIKRPRNTIDVGERDEIVKMWRHLDEKLEDNAKSMNLTAINVKSILHLLIKNPQVISVVMGLEDDARESIPEMRLTRSKRKKPSQEECNAEQNRKVTLPLQAFDNAQVAKTFLDVDYENDEEDDDYQPDENEPGQSEPESEVEEEEEEIGNFHVVDPFASLDDPEVDEISADTSYHLRSRHKNLNDSLIHAEPCPLEGIDIFSSNQELEVLTTVDPEYMDFIHSVTQIRESGSIPNTDDDDPEDEEYNVLNDGLDLDEEDFDEIRNDRATEIPKRERDWLLLHILADEDIPSGRIPPEAMAQPNCLEKCSSYQRALHLTMKQKDEEAVQRIQEMPSDGSCSLLKGGLVTFLEVELRQLAVQLEHHVQLLTQNVALCHHEDALKGVRDESQLMINELEEVYGKGQDTSMFNISNLAASIVTCHEIMNMKKLTIEETRWAYGIDGPASAGYSPRPEAVAVLLRSEAILYPELLPTVQPRKYEHPHGPFLNSENLMLALALLQFVHLPRRSDNLRSILDRYSRISENCLPARSATRIRIHMKSMRAANGKSSSVQHTITEAESGKGALKIFPTELEATRLPGPIRSWPEALQPNWAKFFEKHFKYMSQYELERIVVAKPGQPANQRLQIATNVVQLENVNGNQAIVINTQQLLGLLSTIYPSLVKLPSELSVEVDGERTSSASSTHEGVSPTKAASAEDGTLKSLEGPKLSKNALTSEEKCVKSVERRLEEQKTPQKRQAEHSADVGVEVDMCASVDRDDCSRNTFSKFIPRTPGKGSPQYSFIDFVHGDESNMSFDPAMHYAVDEASNQIPPTPCRWYDRVHMDQCTSSSDSINHGTPNEDTLSCLRRSEDPSQIERKRKAADEAMYCSDFLCLDDSSFAQRRGKKRSRAEKEGMGSAGMCDERYRYWQQDQLARKIASDVRLRMFMHQEMWTRMRSVMATEDISPVEQVEQLKSVLDPLPEVFTLMSVLIPDNLVPVQVLSDERRIAYLGAIEMLATIDAYFTAAKIKQPKIRQCFRLLIALGEEKLDSAEAAKKTFQLFGNERPLWTKLKKHFYASKFDEPCAPEKFEFVDITMNESRDDSLAMETIDDLDAVLGPSKAKTKGPLQVSKGQLLAAQRGAYVPVDVVKNGRPKEWSREMDLLLLTTYNDNDSVDVDDVPRLLPDLIGFPHTDVVRRLRYLLSFF